MTPIDLFLRQNEEKELLRFSTAGSVDDGKSTLIGRLLYDSKGVYEDQLASVRKASTNQTAGALDFALLTDGLRAEREQGITIDVAYRYFSTPKRKFIIADTPGHEQYTRNMATGASTAELAIILIDARNGVLPQSRRHAYISSLLGIPNLVVAINKMDLVDFRQEVFEAIRTEFGEFVSRLGVREPVFIPISALLGDNVVERSARTPWYEGPILLEHLETAPVAAPAHKLPLRFPVQYVIRPHLDFRGYAGQVASGTVRTGDAVMVLPSGRTSRVAKIATYDGDLARAFPPMSVTICLEDEIDISRGDMLAHPQQAPHVARRIESHVVWMNEQALQAHRPYLIKHTTHTVKGSVSRILYKVDVNTLAHAAAGELKLNEIGAVLLETHRPLYFDPYAENRATGGFVLIDPISNLTVGAGMIIRAHTAGTGAMGRVTAAERHARSGHWPGTVWIHGEVDLAHRVERALFERGLLVRSLDAADASAARALNDAGVIAICTGPADDEAMEVVGAERFVEVDAASLGGDAVLEVCRLLESRGWIPAVVEPFTGGDGI